MLLCCAGIALATVIVSYLADVALQIYLRQAMQKLYTGVCLRRAQWQPQAHIMRVSTLLVRACAAATASAQGAPSVFPASPRPVQARLVPGHHLLCQPQHF